MPAAEAALAALSRGDWRPIEEQHGHSADWDTRGAIANALADLDPFDDWIGSAPDSALAYEVRGAQLIRLAWDVRGGGKAATVAADAWGDFFAILEAAEQSLVRAAELAPADPYPWFRLIWTATGLDAPVEQRLARFTAMRERDPGYLHGWVAITSVTAKKWGGSHELMFDLAREGDRTLPPGSPGRVGLLQAHHERRLYLANWEDDATGAAAYYTRPDVVAEIAAAALHSVLSPDHRPTASTRLAQSWFAYALAQIGDADPSQRVRAAGLFTALGDRGIPPWPWQIRYGEARAGEAYARIRSLCFHAAGIPEPPAA